MTIRSTKIILIVLVFICWPEYSEACAVLGNSKLELDPAEQEIDFEAPNEVKIQEYWIGRGEDAAGCDDLCAGNGSITIKILAATDNRTDSIEMGYIVELESGTSPAYLPPYAVTAPNEEIYLYWEDGNTDSQEPIDFSVTISAVDLGGNVGPKSKPIHIFHPGSSGCRTSRISPVGICLVVVGLYLGLLALVRKRRTEFTEGS